MARYQRRGRGEVRIAPPFGEAMRSGRHDENIQTSDNQTSYDGMSCAS